MEELLRGLILKYISQQFQTLLVLFPKQIQRSEIVVVIACELQEGLNIPLR